MIRIVQSFSDFAAVIETTEGTGVVGAGGLVAVRTFNEVGNF